MSAATGASPVTPAGRPFAYPDVVAWLESLRDVALVNGHRESARHAAKALDIIAAAHCSVESGFNVDPGLLVALLGVPVVGR